MLEWFSRRQHRRGGPAGSVRRSTRSTVAALARQDAYGSIVKRERWTEQDLEGLPADEHDYFERKSGELFQDSQTLLGALAKAVSAFANSGGGHIVLGVRDDGTPDGVPPMRGSTATRDWLEQKVPYLVNYPLSDFRVHVVERSTPSRVPPDRQVIVIDVGDSALAPHQCDHDGEGARRHIYYHRRAGRSEPAPHFFLELLRQRLVSPVLEAELTDCEAWRGTRTPDGAVFVGSRAQFVVRNVGRVAAYNWGCPSAAGLRMPVRSACRLPG
jgi:hypothetical protein